MQITPSEKNINLGEYYDVYLKVIHHIWLMFLKTLEKRV